MATIDPRIFNPRSVADYDREAYEAEAARQGLGLNSLRLLAGRRAEEDALRLRGEQEGVRGVLARLAGGAGDDEVDTALLRLGTPTALAQREAFGKQQMERRKAEAEIGNKASENEARGFKLAHDRLRAWNDLLAGVTDEASYQAAIPQAVALGMDRAQIPPAFDPGAVQAARQRALTEQQRLEETARQRGLDLTAAGQAQALRIAQMTDERQRAEGAAGRAVTLRGQDLNDARAREGVRSANAPAPSLTTIVDPADPTRMITVDARQWNPQTRAGLVGTSGKEPSAQRREDQASTGREQVSQVVASLRDMYAQLNERGGIVNADSSVLSNIPARLSSTAGGQFAGQLLGTKNQRLRDEIEQKRPLLLNAIKQATGMSAKQMDSNIELKLYLASATDPTKDVAANLAALDNLERLFGQSAGAAAGAGLEPAPGGGVKPGTDLGGGFRVK